MNVLIVDDEVSFRMLMQDCLAEEGYTIFLADDGLEGMTRLAEGKIDIVISDLRMHVMDGLTFCKTARNDPRYRTIPFLFVSAYADKEINGVISSLKNCAFLSKGRPTEEVFQLIRQLTASASQPGEETPLEEPHEPTEPAATPEEEPKIEPKSKKILPEHPRILVVDDDDALRMLLADMLVKEGYDVSTAEDGQAAIDLMKGHAYDLVLLDIMMPNVSGYGVLTFLQTHVHASRIVMLTAYSELDLAVECKTLGADDFIAKPFMRGDLLNTIKHVLQQ